MGALDAWTHTLRSSFMLRYVTRKMYEQEPNYGSYITILTLNERVPCSNMRHICLSASLCHQKNRSAFKGKHNDCGFKADLQRNTYIHIREQLAAQRDCYQTLNCTLYLVQILSLCRVSSNPVTEWSSSCCLWLSLFSDTSEIPCKLLSSACVAMWKCKK
jgi:hypothetical protein